LGAESELAVLEVLELQGSLSLPRISEITKLSELECSSTLSNLITQGFVFRVGDVFSLSFHGKGHLKELRKTSGK
jgi:predicted transcriptional regulator